jgi:hypothetical protein
LSKPTGDADEERPVPVPASSPAVRDGVAAGQHIQEPEQRGGGVVRVRDRSSLRFGEAVRVLGTAADRF